MTSEIQLVISARDEASKSIRSVSSEIEKSTKKMREYLENSTEASKTFAKYISGATVAVGALAGVLGKKSLDAYKEHEEVVATLTKLILNQEGATMDNVNALKEQAKAMEQVTTFGDDVVMSAQKMLATFDFSSETIQKVIPSFLDMVSAEKGVSVGMEEMEQMANGLGKAMQGNTQLFSMMGFELTDLQKKTLDTGTEQQRLATITEVLGTTYDGMAGTLRDTYGGQMEVAKNTLNSFQTEIGRTIQNFILPIIRSFNEWSLSIGGAEGMINILNDKMARMKTFIKENEVLVVMIAGAIAGILVPAIVAWGVAAGVAAIKTLLLLSPLALIGASIAGFAYLVYKNWDSIKGFFESGVNFVKNKINELIEIINKIPGVNFSKIGESVSKNGARALGGSVETGKSYLVGERGPEMFVPSQSGNIRQMSQIGGGLAGAVNVNFNNVNVRNDNDLETIIKEVKRVLGREQELNRLGTF